MQKKKRLGKIALLFCCVMLLAQTLPAHAQAAKSGLVQSGKKLYYYQDGEKVKNCWKTVKGSHYYFGKNGAAYMAPKTLGKSRNIITKTVDGEIFGFDQKGRMVKNGAYANAASRLFCFSKDGTADRAKTQKLRKAAKYLSDAKAIRAILGKPKKTKASSSCFREGGTDLLLTYPNIVLSLYRGGDGKELVLFAEPR